MTARVRLAAAVVTAAVALTACGGETADPKLPGEGVDVAMARADWRTGRFQAEVYANLLRRLGYDVGPPADLEMSTSEFYPRVADGDVDLWANGWFPSHDDLLEEGSEAIGSQVGQGALQGFLIDRATADAHGITSLGDIAADASLVALFDTDANGRAEILGCNDSWACATVIDGLIEEVDAESLEQIKGDYEDHVELALGRIKAGEPVLLYAWTPAPVPSLLKPGNEVLWLDTSPGGDPSLASIDRGTCTRVRCRLGWPPDDIRVVASSAFLEANPAARALLEAVVIPLDDITEQNAAMDSGLDRQVDIEAWAEQWLGRRRAQVLDWLTEARRAAAESG